MIESEGVEAKRFAEEVFVDHRAECQGSGSFLCGDFSAHGSSSIIALDAVQIEVDQPSLTSQRLQFFLNFKPQA